MKGLLLACGHVGAHADRVKADLVRYRADPRVRVIVTTEHYTGAWRRFYDAPGWGWVKVGEHLVTWRSTEFVLTTPARLRILSARTWYARTGRARPGTKVAVVRLRSRRRIKLHIIAVGHFPSHIENALIDGRQGVANRVKVAEEGFASLGKLTRRWRRLHPRAVRVVSQDWNLNHHRAKVREVIGEHLYGLHLPVLPPGGDLGRRLVAATWTSEPNGHLVRLESMSSDHRAVLVT